VIRRALLVVNPSSRRGTRDRVTAERAFRDQGVEVDTVLTERPGHAGEIAAALAPGVDAVFALGGDGTAMEILSAVGPTGRPVGVLAGGTGNLLARALGTPRDVRKAVRALVRGTERRIDLGCLASGRMFAVAAGVGLDVTMLERTTARAKRRFGVMAYAAAAARATLAADRFALQATVDGRSATFDASSAFVANFGTMLNGSLTLGPDISPTDGMLDLCVFTPKRILQTLWIGWRMRRARFAGSPNMHFLRGKSFTLETDPPRMTQADGELLGPTPLSCTVQPLAARLLVAYAPEGGRAH
jgi:YegS/Rv2252/BmrU family lipid kinase